MNLRVNNMKLLVLGAGRNQIGLINKAHEMGHQVIVCDYLPDAPGRRLADVALPVSTLDQQGVLRAADEYKVDGITTVGTDQPVAVAAWVAEQLHLPFPISYTTARACTNKVLMKEVYQQAGIACPRSMEIRRKDIGPGLAAKIKPLGGLPLVVKPADSQGQRGIYLITELNSTTYALINDSFNFTHQETILLEEYVEGAEITVSAWVNQGKPIPLLVTDRPLLNVKPHLGLPTAHVYPSRAAAGIISDLSLFIEKVCQAFGVKNGPVYLQIIIDSQGRPVMNEIACRVGGGHEDRLIPLVSGFDILEAVVKLALGELVITPCRGVGETGEAGWLSGFSAAIKFLFAQPGQVERVEGLEKALALPGVQEVVLYNPELAEVLPLSDSTRRIGYMLVTAPDRKELVRRVENAYAKVQVISPQGINMTIYPELPV